MENERANKGGEVIVLKTQLISFSEIFDTIPLLDSPAHLGSLTLPSGPELKSNVICVFYWMDGWMMDGG